MADKRAIGDIIATLKTDGQTLAKDHIALAKAEVKPTVKRVGITGGLFGGAGYFGLVGALMLWLCGAFAFSLMWKAIGNWSILLSLVVGFATMGVVMLVIAGILALAGKGQAQKITPPTTVVDQAKETVASLKSSIERGKYKATVEAERPAIKDLD